MTVTNVNEGPTITSAATFNAAENQTAAGTITSSDPDGGAPSYSISGGADAASFSINSTTGALSFQGAPDFEAPTDTDANNVYEVSVQVSDGNGGTDTEAIAVTVTNVNEGPTITSSAAFNAPENQTAVTTVTSSDPDGGAPSYSISGGADQAKFSIDSTSGQLSFQSAPDFEAPTDTDANNVYEVSVQVSDGNGGTDTKAIAVTVTNVNEGPTITSSPTFNAPENQTAAGTTTSADPDGDTPSYSISGGADQAKFSIDSTSGALSFTSAPDFEAPTDTGANNVYEVSVQVSDGNGGTDTKAITVTVTNVNEPGPPPATPATSPTPPLASEDPKCERLRKKMHRWQQRKLSLAPTDSKRAHIRANIIDSKRRLKQGDCEF